MSWLRRKKVLTPTEWLGAEEAMKRRNDLEGDREDVEYKCTLLSPNNKRSKQTAMQSQTWMPTI